MYGVARDLNLGMSFHLHSLCTSIQVYGKTVWVYRLVQALDAYILGKYQILCTG